MAASRTATADAIPTNANASATDTSTSDTSTTDTSTSTSTSPSTTDTSVEVRSVAESMSAMMRNFIRLRSQFVAQAGGDGERTSHLLLKGIAHEGPIRATALAELVDSDPSTVSRQVAALVRDGYIERRADPGDGRASLLALTPRGEQRVRANDAARDARYAQMLSSWNSDDLRHFASMLERFTDDFARHKKEWIPDNGPNRPAPAEGTM